MATRTALEGIEAPYRCPALFDPIKRAASRRVVSVFLFMEHLPPDRPGLGPSSQCDAVYRMRRVTGFALASMACPLHSSALPPPVLTMTRTA